MKQRCSLSGSQETNWEEDRDKRKIIVQRHDFSDFLE